MSIKDKFNSIYEYSPGNKIAVTTIIRKLNLNIEDYEFESWMKDNIGESSVTCIDLACYLNDYKKKNSSLSRISKTLSATNREYDAVSQINPNLPRKDDPQPDQNDFDARTEYTNKTHTDNMLENILRILKDQNEFLIHDNTKYDKERIIQLLTYPDEYNRRLERRHPEQYQHQIEKLRGDQRFRLANGNEIRASEVTKTGILESSIKHFEFMKIHQPKDHYEFMEYLGKVKSVEQTAAQPPKSAYSIFDLGFF